MKRFSGEPVDEPVGDGEGTGAGVELARHVGQGAAVLWIENDGDERADGEETRAQAARIADSPRPRASYSFPKCIPPIGERLVITTLVGRLSST